MIDSRYGRTARGPLCLTHSVRTVRVFKVHADRSLLSKWVRCPHTSVLQPRAIICDDGIVSQHGRSVGRRHRRQLYSTNRRVSSTFSCRPRWDARSSHSQSATVENEIDRSFPSRRVAS